METKRRINLFLVVIAVTTSCCSSCFLGSSEPHEWELNKKEKEWVENSEHDCGCEIEVSKGSVYNNTVDVQKETCTLRFTFPDDVLEKDTTDSKEFCKSMTLSYGRSFSKVIERPELFNYVECWYYRGDFFEHVIYDIRKDRLVD